MLARAGLSEACSVHLYVVLVIILLQSLKEEREDWPQFKSKDEAKTFLVVSQRCGMLVKLFCREVGIGDSGRDDSY